MDNEETIKQIQKLVPSVMALEFGCVIKRYGTKENPQNILYKVLENRALMTGISRHDTSYNKLICYDYTFEQLQCFRSENEKENPIKNSKILGKPITLAVVLMAIDTKYTEWENPGTPVAINSKGEFQDWSENPVYKNVFWNLSKDNFNDQSKETKIFIGELLVDKE